MQILYCLLEIIFLPGSHMMKDYSLLSSQTKQGYDLLSFIIRLSTIGLFLFFRYADVLCIPVPGVIIHTISLHLKFLERTSLLWFQILSVINHNLPSNVIHFPYTSFISEQLVYSEALERLIINQIAGNKTCTVK